MGSRTSRNHRRRRRRLRKSCREGRFGSERRRGRLPEDPCRLRRKGCLSLRRRVACENGRISAGSGGADRGVEVDLSDKAEVVTGLAAQFQVTARTGYLALITVCGCRARALAPSTVGEFVLRRSPDSPCLPFSTT